MFGVAKWHHAQQFRHTDVKFSSRPQYRLTDGTSEVNSDLSQEVVDLLQASVKTKLFVFNIHLAAAR